MQDGKRKSKKAKITRDKIFKFLEEKYDFKVRDPEDNLNKAFETLEPRYLGKTKKILEKYLDKVSSAEKHTRRMKGSSISLIEDFAKGSHSATLVRNIGVSARYADKNMQDQGGSEAFFDFLEHVLDKEDVFPHIYVRLASFLKPVWAGLGKKSAHKWFDIIEEQAKKNCPRELIEAYAIMSTRNLDNAVRSWAGVEKDKIPNWAVNPEAVRKLIDEMHKKKKMRGREVYFLELAMNAGANAARKFIDDTYKTSLETFLLLYEIRNNCMKGEDPRKDELIAARLTGFSGSIDTLEGKMQAQIVLSANNIIKAEPKDFDRLDTIIKASEKIKDAENLQTTLEYADKYMTNWRYDEGLLEEFIDDALIKTERLFDFKDYQEVLYQVYTQEKRKNKYEEGLFSKIQERMDKVFNTSVLDEDKILAAGKSFTDQGLYLASNGSQDIMKFLEDYRRLLDMTQKKSRFVRDFIEGILEKKSQYKPYLSVLTKLLSAFAGSFSKEKFDKWKEMLAERFEQKDRVHMPQYIRQSVAGFAGTDTDTTDEVIELKERFFNKINEKSEDKKKKPYFLPEEFHNTELIFLDAKKAVGRKIDNEAFFRLFEFCCDYYVIVRPTLLPESTSNNNLADLYDILRLFAKIPAKEQDWYIGRAEMLLEEHAGRVDKVRQMHNDAAIPELRNRLDAEYKIVRDSLRKLVFSYFRNIPDRIKKLGSETARMWTDAGIAPKTFDEAIKYFSQRSYTSELSRDKLLQGTKYESVAGSLHTYAEGLTGKRLSFDKTDSIEITSSIEEGKVILPMTVTAFGNDYDNNYSIYKMLTSYQIAFIEFGTYHFDESVAKKIIERNQENCPDEMTLAHLMNSYANADAAAYIFTLLENARVKSRLLERYPGLRKEASVFEDYLRSNLIDRAEDIGEQEMPMTVLYQTCLLGKPVFKLAGKGKKLGKAIISEIDNLLLPDATVNDTLELTDKLYGLLGIQAHDFIASEPPVANINLEKSVAGSGSGGFLEEDESIDAQTGPYLPFPEWDVNTGRHKANFVSVYEKPVEIIEGDGFVAAVLQEDSQDLHKIRRQFEALKPEEYLTLKKQLSGEPDFDRIVEAKAMIKAGVTPSEKLFMRRYKNQRSVATLFLTDLSGSLRKFLDLDNPTTRLLDIHKKTCLYMCEALENIGDAYAIYGFSGKTRQKVDTYLIKGFDEEYGHITQERISSLRPLQQNRDGAGIRYSTHLLSHRPEKTKIMVYLLEGAPHDVDYKDRYAIADTREALREARTAGLHPVIIFIGNSDEDSVKKIGDGFRFAHVSDINDVPAKLPDIYRRLTT